jgi:aminoglycoside phosphotransferase (APT) family kinase protein
MLQLIQSLQDNRVALVHGDFDPDNLLVWDDDLMLVDYEVGHYGDPAFDLGFFFSRLVAQAFCAADRKARLPLLDAFWAAYSRALDVRVAEEQGRRLFARAMWSLGASALAAVDGKSRVDYLVDNELRDRVRAFGRAVLLQPPNNWDDCRRTVLSHLETC